MLNFRRSTLALVLLVGSGCALAKESPHSAPHRISEVALTKVLESPQLQASSAPSSKAAPALAVRIDEDLLARPLSKDAWIITHERPFPSNSLVVKMPDHRLLLVDTPMTAAATERLLLWLDTRFGSQERVAVNTHHHFDAAGGNQALLASGVTIWGADSTARLIRDRGASMKKEMMASLSKRPADAQRFADHVPTPPNRQFDLGEGVMLRFGTEIVRVLHPGPAHSPDNVVVWLPARKLLFGGCMVVGMKALGYLGEADLEGWPDAIRVLKALGAATVIPGHGRRTDPQLLEHTRALVQAELALRHDKRKDGPR